MTRDRQRAHQLLDERDASQFAAIANLLEAMVDPVARSIAGAPAEDEEVTPDTAAELARARASTEQGRGVSHDEMLREFGLPSR